MWILWDLNFIQIANKKFVNNACTGERIYFVIEQGDP